MGDSSVEANNLTKNLNKYVTRIVEREGYINSEVEARNASSNGGSFMGSLYEIDIKGETQEGYKETHIFAKRIIEAEAMIFSIEDVYKKELFAYRELSKVFNDLQNEGDVPDNERYKMADFFEESDKDMIILENLAKEGFKTYFRTDILSIDFARLAVKQLARFHGLSFVLKSKRPDYFKKHIESVEVPYQFNKLWNDFVNNMANVSLNYLGDLKDKYEQVILKKLNDYPKYMMSEDCKVRTLCHGDYRHNNILVHEVNGKPSRLVPVDYQIMHFGNPILDFFYLIFWGTDQEFRRQYLTILKDLYFDELKTFLKYFDLDVEEVFPKAEFEKQYKEKIDFGVIISVIYLPVSFPVEDEIQDLSNAKEADDLAPTKIDVEYGKRFRGIIEDFIEWGYLKNDD